MRVRFLIVGVFVGMLAGPAVAHQWVSYFEAGKADLSTRGFTLAREVAAYCRQPRSCTAVYVDAHQDSAEARRPEGHEDLERARAMQLELVRQGISPAIINIRLHAANGLARPTDQAEPLNRRVSVDVVRAIDVTPPAGQTIPPRSTRLDHSDMPTIYFESGSTRIQPIWAHVLRLLAVQYREGCWINVKGRTDTLGSSDANRRLGERRAESVARFLAMNGVPWAALRLDSAGEGALSRPTADGVAEPLNRVVALDMRCPWRGP